MRLLSSVMIGLLCVLPAALGPLSPAWAHASIVKSTPANGAVLKQPPSVVQAAFSEELDKASVIRLYDAHQNMLAKGGLDPKVSSHRVLALAAPHLAPGAYSVQWVAISSDDGDVKKGSFKFSVAAMAMVPPLRLISPAGHAQVKNPVAVVLETPGDMSQLTMGQSMAPMKGMPGMGGAAALHVHLHIIVDATVYMPAESQLTKVGPNRYTYQLPKLAAGTHTVKVFWADNSTHAPAGSVETATYTVTG